MKPASWAVAAAIGISLGAWGHAQGFAYGTIEILPVTVAPNLYMLSGSGRSRSRTSGRGGRQDRSAGGAGRYLHGGCAVCASHRRR